VEFPDGQVTGGAASAMGTTTPTGWIASNAVQTKLRDIANRMLVAIMVMVVEGLVTGTVLTAMHIVSPRVWNASNAVNPSLSTFRLMTKTGK